MNSCEMRERKSGAPKELRIIPKRMEMEEEEEEPEPLSPYARVFRQAKFNCFVMAIMGFGKKLEIERIKAGLESTLIKHPRFSSIQVLQDGKVRHWVRTKVVLEDHMVIPDVVPDMTDSDKFVEDYISGLSRTSIDMSKPLWDLHILNVGTSKSEAVAVFRIHHSLGDGISLISLLLACTRKSSDPDSLPSLPTANKRTMDYHGTLFFLPFLVQILTLLKVVRNTIVDSVMFIATYLFLKDTHTPLKGVEGVEFHPKRFIHLTLSLDDFKLVKNAMNTTVNDVMLGVTFGGLSRYFARRYGIEGTSGWLSLQKNTRVRAVLLVNQRPTPGIQAMADMMEKRSVKAQWGNKIGYVLLPFPMVLRDDPLDYVREAKQIVDRKKLSYEAFLTLSTCSFLVETLGLEEGAAALAHRIMSNTSLAFSNVVGPTEEISFLGHPLVYLAPSAYGHPHALTFHFQSYMNKVEMVLAVDEEAIPDPHQLCEDLADALNLIKGACSSNNTMTDIRSSAMKHNQCMA